ncbi:hypothetical protein [Methylobacterium marchantiae]|uniref:Uncharacterized protein n=1 Tax=Methylobacterium marchantiae TaxID=600331 RepID=A0ABW3X4D8_9HYPH|nr:hypothetical protein AIGOOFII_3481 [Methylobacterium marchantiae]
MADDPDNTDKDLLKAAFEALEGKSLMELLEAGQVALVRNLVAAAQAGTISHQEAGVLRNLLRDNGMTMGLPPGGMKTIEHEPPRALPSFSKPDYEE